MALGATGAALLGGLGALPAFAQASLFEARDVPVERFVLVAAPIGNGERAQLNIYEQIKDTRACFATSGAAPAQVEPLLGSFDFTGICSRYIDGNGYSLRVGGDDLATVYRLSVIRQGGDTVLLAAPTKAGAGPEMVVARSGGQGNGFLQLVFEPGWKLMRRHFSGRPLGHVYVYRDGWPGAMPDAMPAAEATPAAPAATPAVSPAAPAAPPVAPVAPAVPGTTLRTPSGSAPSTVMPLPAATPASAPAGRKARKPKAKQRDSVSPAAAPAPASAAAAPAVPTAPAPTASGTSAATLRPASLPPAGAPRSHPLPPSRR